MPATSLDPVLITGCSSGIGAAGRPARQGGPHGLRHGTPETLADLESAGARTLALDVTSEESMTAAVKRIEDECGRVGTLVNNAGYGEYGTIEEADLDRVRAMFETNVFGLARLTQLVLPGMRRAQRGRVVNVSSMGGRITFPVGGYYHATKYAVEAISDALRNEVRPFGIDVVVVEPGLIRTRFEDTVHASVAGSAGGQGDSPYAALLAQNAANTSGATPTRSSPPPGERGARDPQGHRGRAPAYPVHRHPGRQGDGGGPHHRRRPRVGRHRPAAVQARVLSVVTPIPAVRAR